MSAELGLIAAGVGLVVDILDELGALKMSRSAAKAAVIAKLRPSPPDVGGAWDEAKKKNPRTK